MRKQSRKKVRKAPRRESELRRILSLTPQMLTVMEPDGRISWANESVLDYLGISPADLGSDNLRQLVLHPDDLQQLNEARQKALANGEPFENEQRMRGKDGKYRWFLIRYKPLKDAEGRPMRWYGGATDIEERKEVEAALRKREKELQDIFDTIPVIAFVHLPDGSGGVVNRRWLEYTGSPPRQFGDVDPDDPAWRESTCIHPDDFDDFVAVWTQCLATGKPFEHEIRLRRADGEYRWVLDRAVPLRDEHGNILKWYGVSTDIEDRKHAEEALRRREKELQDIFDTIPAIVIATLPDGSGGIPNRRWLEYTGSPPREYRGIEPDNEAWREATYMHPADIDPFLKAWTRGMTTGEPFEYEARLRRVDGEYRWMLIRAAPLLDAQGKILRWYWVDTDIEDRRQAEEAVRRREKELQDIFDTMPVIAFVTLPDGSSGAANRRWLEYTGTPLQPAASVEPDNPAWREATCIHPEDLDGLTEAWKRSITTGEPFEYEARLRRADGEYRWMLVRAVPLRDDRGNILKWYGIDTDIEDRKRAEQAVRRSEAYLAGAQELTHTGSWALDGKSRELRYWSEEMFRMYGFDPQQGLPRLEQARQRIHPEDRGKVKERDDKTFFERVASDVEFRIVLPDATVKHIRALAHPVLGVHGELVEVVGTNVDITEQKRHQAQITALNERLMQAQEEERTRIAGELHDGVLQQITSVSLLLGAVRYEAPPDSEVNKEIGGLQRRLIQVGTDIRRLSHELHPAVLQEGGLPDALSAYCEEFSKTRGIPVTCEADESAKELSRGAGLVLYRIAQEALGNVAKHAQAKHVQVRLKRSSGRVRLTVSDDGVGCAPDQAREVGGLGLVNMRERVRQLKGAFEFRSEPGRGTTVTAEVPFRPAS
jgi:PAS domain S-box-containing protein